MDRLLTAAEIRAIEAGCGIPADVLMERAGRAVATHAASMVTQGGRISVLCGPGNNGGDGYVAAAILRERGFDVSVLALAVPRPGSEAAKARWRWVGPVAGPEDRAAFEGAALVVDALFGIGLTRDLDGAAHRLIEQVTASEIPILAVDLPSGVDGDTGQVRGIALRARRTISFFALKAGHALLPGRSFAGEVAVDALGVDLGRLSLSPEPRAFPNRPVLWRREMPHPDVDGHKYRRGHVLTGSGGAFRTGAARLAAMGALRAGAGVVTVAAPREALPVHAAHLTAVMLQPCDGPQDLAGIVTERKVSAVVLGPNAGPGAALRDLVAQAARLDCALVLDADALTSFAGEPAALAEILARTGKPVVLTPHSGEFARLFGPDSETLRHPSKLEQARHAAAIVGAIIVLKGADTVIATPDGRAAVNMAGSPYLATAGSGDVLGGIVAGLLAQGMPGFEAACAGVWIHAAAAERFGPGLIAEDLPGLVPSVLHELLA